MSEISSHTLFEEEAETTPEIVIYFGFLFGFFFECFEEALGDDLVQFLNQGAILHRLAGNVERQVGAVDDATHEAQPVGKEILRLVVDEHFAAVEAYTRLHTAKTEAFHIFSWRVEDGVDFEGCIGVEVKPKARLVEGLGLEFVELFVFFLGDVALTFEPDRADGVEFLAIHQYGELHEGGILFNDLFDTILLREVLILILERNHDTGAATFALDLLYLVSA